jgi:hypothetical protein
MGDLSLDLGQSHLANLVTGCEPSVFQARQMRKRGEQVANDHGVFHGVPPGSLVTPQSSRHR